VATLTWANYKELRAKAYRKGYGKEELKALSRLPNKTELMAMFQACEDWFVNSFNNTPSISFKDALSTAFGQTITNSLAQKVAVIWFAWKAPQII